MIYLTENACKRLLGILILVRQSKDKDTLLDIWGKALNVEDCNKNRSEFYRKLAQVTALPERIRQQLVIAGDLNMTLFMSWKNDIDYLLNFNNFSANWSSIKNHITEKSITALEFCSEKISEVTPELNIDGEELSVLIEETEILINDFKSSSLSPEIQEFAIKNLKGIIRAIYDSHIVGIKSIEAQWHQTSGDLFWNQEKLKIIKQNEKSFNDRFWKIINKTAAIVTLIGVLQLPQQTSNPQIENYILKNEIHIEQNIIEHEPKPQNKEIPQREKDEDAIIDV